MVKRNRTKKMRAGACMFNANGKPTATICPGVSKLAGRDYIPFNKDTSVYFLWGHGCDLIDDIQDVPKNCAYVTKASCGVSSGLSDSMKKFIEDFSAGNDLLKNPYLISNIKAEYNPKEEEVKEDPQLATFADIHVHYSEATDPNMRKFVNNKNWTVAFIGYTSGLYRIGTKNINERVPKEGTLLEYYSNHYKNSLFPTEKDIRETLDILFTKEELSIDVSTKKYSELTSYNSKFESAIKNTYSIDFASLMKVFPGIYYNLECRPVCRGGLTNNNSEARDPRVAARRRASSVGNQAEVGSWQVVKARGGNRKNRATRRAKN